MSSVAKQRVRLEAAFTRDGVKIGIMLRIVDAARCRFLNESMPTHKQDYIRATMPVAPPVFELLLLPPTQQSPSFARQAKTWGNARKNSFYRGTADEGKESRGGEKAAEVCNHVGFVLLGSALECSFAIAARQIVSER